MQHDPSEPTVVPVPVRVRRLLDPRVVTDAYGTGAVAKLPDEIVDLSDGTCVCEWGADPQPREVALPRFRGESQTEHEERLLRTVAYGIPRTTDDSIMVQDVRRVRYASEDDMWRAVAAIAAKHRHEVTGRFTIVRTATVDGWAAPQHRTEVTVVSKAVSDDVAETDAKAHGCAVADRALSEAWVDRPAALRVLLAESHEDLTSLRVESVPKPGEADDRPLDVLGRRNGGARSKSSARAATLRL